MVGLEGMVPPCVEREIQSERGSLCWWVTWKWDEQMRVQQKLRPPDTVDWQRQWDVMRVFRELVDDTDRNQTNMLITEDWKVWMVDFSRAFRKTHALRKPEDLQRCPKTLLERIRALDDATVRAATSEHLRPGEIEAVLVRRKLIVEHFDALSPKGRRRRPVLMTDVNVRPPGDSGMRIAMLRSSHPTFGTSPDPTCGRLPGSGRADEAQVYGLPTDVRDSGHPTGQRPHAVALATRTPPLQSGTADAVLGFYVRPVRTGP